MKTVRILSIRLSGSCWECHIGVTGLLTVVTPAFQMLFEAPPRQEPDGIKDKDGACERPVRCPVSPFNLYFATISCRSDACVAISLLAKALCSAVAVLF